MRRRRRWVFTWKWTQQTQTSKRIKQSSKQPRDTNKPAATNQVVFHWPANLDANTRVRSVGLIEAVVRWLLEYFNGLIEPFEVWRNL